MLLKGTILTLAFITGFALAVAFPPFGIVCLLSLFLGIGSK